MLFLTGNVFRQEPLTTLRTDTLINIELPTK